MSDIEDGELVVKKQDDMDGQVQRTLKKQPVAYNNNSRKPQQVKQQQQPKFAMKSSNFRTKVCEHFKKGACKNGANCSFQHPKEYQHLVRICKFFLGGACQNQLCQFSHDVSKYQCKFFFIGGNCKEEKCRFSHDIWDNELQKQQWVLENDPFIRDIYLRKQTTGLGQFYDDIYQKKAETMNMPQQQQYFNPNLGYAMPNQLLPPQLPQQYGQLNIFQTIQPPSQQIYQPFMMQQNWMQQQQEQFRRMGLMMKEQQPSVDNEQQQSIISGLPPGVEAISEEDDRSISLQSEQPSIRPEAQIIRKRKFIRTNARRKIKSLEQTQQCIQGLPIRKSLIDHFFILQ